MSAQKVIITLTDKGEGKVGCTLDFDPAIKADAPATPALNLALEMMEVISKNHEHSQPEVKP
jgi:hypothetical protein